MCTRHTMCFRLIKRKTSKEIIGIVQTLTCTNLTCGIMPSEIKISQTDLWQHSKWNTLCCATRKISTVRLYPSKDNFWQSSTTVLDKAKVKYDIRPILLFDALVLHSFHKKYFRKTGIFGIFAKFLWYKVTNAWCHFVVCTEEESN